jgi:repressor LexA
MALSERQKRMMNFITRFSVEHGYPPTIREIGAAVGIPSTSVVNYNLNVLQREGYLTRSPDVSRGISIVELERDTTKMVGVPILGTIAAGEPIPVPDVDFSPFDYETLMLTTDMIAPQEGLYALHVKGTSMIDALVNDGDFVVLKHQHEARNGEMVAVRLKNEDETTLKFFFLEGDRVRLQPANPLMQPIYTHPSNVDVQGKVMVVIRQLG